MAAFDSGSNDDEGYIEGGSRGGQGISASEVGLRFLVATTTVLVEMVEEGMFFLWMRRWFSACQVVGKIPFFKPKPKSTN